MLQQSYSIVKWDISYITLSNFLLPHFPSINANTDVENKGFPGIRVNRPAYLAGAT